MIAPVNTTSPPAGHAAAHPAERTSPRPAPVATWLDRALPGTPLGVWVLSALIALPVLGWCAPAAWIAHEDARTRRDQLAAARVHAGEIAAARAGLPAWARRGEHRTAEHSGDGTTGAAPGTSLAQEVSALLAATGLPPSTLASLSTAGEGTAGGPTLAGPGSSNAPRLLRRRASVALSGLTLPQLGGVLAAWRERLDAWAIVSVEVAPIDGPAAAAPATFTHAPPHAAASPPASGGASTPSSSPPGTGRDLPLRVALVAESLSLVEPPVAARAASRTAGTPSTAGTPPGSRPRGSGAGSPQLPGPRTSQATASPSPPPPAPSATGARP